MDAQLPNAVAIDLVPHRSLGRYELLVPLARGGMAMVWAARLKGDRGFEKLFAVKTMLPGMSDNAEFEKMFLDEATLASRIRHPHVVEILDLGEQDKILYIVMEWVEGEPLNVIMNAASSQGGIPVPIGIRIAMQACAGLHAAHELADEQGRALGLVHRDVSPQNVLVTYGGVTKVADFGIAKAMARGGGSTQVGEVKGKVAYMAPEQALGNPVDRRADVFGLGILLFQLATGTHPFRGDTDAETFARIALGEPVVFPRHLAPDYPASLEAVVLKALAQDPLERYESANALLRALDKALPPSMRGTVADEEVGAFVRSLFGEAREARNAQLTAALREAEQRAARMGSGAMIAGAGAITSDTNAGTALASDAPPRPGKRRALMLGSIAAVVAIAGVTAGLFARGGLPRTDEASARAAAAPSPEPPPKLEPAPASTAQPVPESSAPPAAPASFALPSASAPALQPGAPRSPRRSAPEPKKTAPESAQPTKSPTETKPRPGVSPVRSPGF
jgi:eukaryotic-like serine/threonine-protein kinase